MDPSSLTDEFTLKMKSKELKDVIGSFLAINLCWWPGDMIDL